MLLSVSTKHVRSLSFAFFWVQTYQMYISQVLKKRTKTSSSKKAYDKQLTARVHEQEPDKDNAKSFVDRVGHSRNLMRCAHSSRGLPCPLMQQHPRCCVHLYHHICVIICWWLLLISPAKFMQPMLSHSRCSIECSAWLLALLISSRSPHHGESHRLSLGKGCLVLVGKDIELDAVGLQFEPYLYHLMFCMLVAPCGRSVPKQSWY